MKPHSRPESALVDAGRRASLNAAWRWSAGLAVLWPLALGSRAASPEAREANDAAQASAPPATVRFLGRDAGIAALTQAPGDRYFDYQGLLEIRARMNAPLEGVSLAAARRAVREFEAGAVLDFTADERKAIGAVIDGLQGLLATRAPLYARTPWSFVKLADRAEGGMPHTRGPHVVLPASVCAAFSSSPGGEWADGRSLLLHEQTHVLQRADAARFEPLYTEVFGFTRLPAPPSTPWLRAHRVINPDAPRVEWAFALEQIGGSGWIMPDVLLPDVARPRMPRDFQAVAVALARDAQGWRVIEEGGRPRLRDLAALAGYDAHFPFAEEDFHPNEIAAVLLAHWILQDVPGLDALPLMDGAAAWARRALA